LCDSIGMQPKPNNGTLRLPLKPVGLHSPGTTIEQPADPVSSYTLPVSSASIGIDTVVPVLTTAASITQQLTVDPVNSEVVARPTTSTTTVSVTTPGEPTGQPANDDSKTPVEKATEAAKSFWDWFTDKVDEIWDKITGNKSG
jgi:hypothetical protein